MKTVYNTLFLNLINLLHIWSAFFHPSCLPIPLLQPLSIHSSDLVKKGADPALISTIHGIAIVLSLGKAVQYGEQVPKSQPKCDDQPRLPFLGVPQVYQATQLSSISRGPRSVPCSLPDCWFILCELLWAISVLSVDFLVISLIPLAPTILLPSLQQDSPSLS